MASPNFNEPLTQLPQAQTLDVPTATGASQSQAKFFDNMTQMFSQEAQRVDERRLQEKEREAQQEATEKGIEAGTESAESGISPKQKEEDSLYNRVFNKQAVDAWQSQTRIEAYEFAEKQFEENKFDPKSFRENIEEYKKGVEEELPEEAIPQFRSTVNRQKERFLPRIEKNYTRRKQQEHRNVFQDELKKKRKAIRDMATENPESQQTLNNIKREFDSALNVIAQYGPEGEFELAGRTFFGGNGAIELDEAKEMYDNLRRTTASELIVTKFRKQGSLDDMRQYRSQFAKDMDRPQEEQEIETGTDMVLSDETRQNILSRMDTVLEAQGKLSGTSMNLDDALGDEIMAAYRRGEEPPKESLAKFQQQVAANLDTEEGREWKNKLARGQRIKDTARVSSTFATKQDYRGAIQKREERLRNLKKQDLSPEAFKVRSQQLRDEISFLSEEKQNFESNIKNPVNWAKQNLDSFVKNAPRSDIKTLAGKYDLSVDEIKDRMKINDLKVNFLEDEDGNIVGITDESQEQILERVKDSQFISKYTGRELQFFGNNERQRFVRKLKQMDSQQKIQILGTMKQAIDSSSDEDTQAVFQALKEISSEAGVEGKNFAQAGAVSATNPQAAESAIKGAEIKSELSEGEDESFSLTGDVGRQVEDIMFQHLNEDALPLDKISRIKQTTKNILIDELVPGGTREETGSVTNAIDAVTEFAPLTDPFVENQGEAEGSLFTGQILSTKGDKITREQLSKSNAQIPDNIVRRALNKALGARKTQDGEFKGGLGQIDGNKVTLPPSLTNQQANKWWKTIVSKPQNVDTSPEAAKIKLSDFANILGKNVEAREIARFTDYDPKQSLDQKELSNLMTTIKKETGKTIPGFSEDKKTYDKSDAFKLINRVNPKFGLAQKLFSKEGNPLSVLSTTGTQPRLGNEKYTIEDLRNDYEAESIELKSSAKDGAFLVKIRGFDYLQNPNGGLYKMDFNKLSGSPPIDPVAELGETLGGAGF